MIVKLPKMLMISIFSLFAACQCLAAERILYEENFDKCADGADLSSLGWRVVSSDKQSNYTVKGGRLYIQCQQNPYLGGFAEIPVPLCRRGVLEFDANIAIENAGNADGIGLTLDLYNISTFWHDSCHDWRQYFPEPVAKRMPWFNVEPVGHQSIGKLEKNQWIHYKIYFDTDKDRVEFYIDNMLDPCYINGEAPVLGRAEYQGRYLRIGNFGLMKGPVTYAIDNLSLRELDKDERSDAGQRNLVLLFQGISFPEYNIKPALIAAGVKEADIRTYTLDFWRSAETPENMFKLSQLPGSTTMAQAKAIVLVDLPRGPKQVLPDFLLREFGEQINGGAHLIVFGGLFTLDKGEFQNSVMAKILPVEFENQWQVKVQQEPLTIAPTSPGVMEGIDWSAKPALYGFHQLKLKPQAETLLKAGEHPLLVRQKMGRGQVTVFLGTTCGKPVPQPPAFWQWKEWPKLASELVLSGLETKSPQKDR